MSKRPFMQFYVSDFVGDTLALSAQHVGVYMLLLIAMWNGRGALENDERKLATVSRLSLKRWREIAPDLMPFFEVEELLISHNRLTKELQKSDRQSQSRRSAGERGNQAKALKKQSSVLANANALRTHLPEPYRKSENSPSKKDEEPSPPSTVTLDRHASHHAKLFEACETVMGSKVPPYLQQFAFPLAVAAQAHKLLADEVARQQVRREAAA